jgi:hypothetical protein
MKNIVVGGNPGEKVSTIVSLIAREIGAIEANGIIPNSLKGFDLTVWMPNIDNSKEKVYPVKDKGSVLICSKVMREGYTRIDSVSRIFKMHANAVIEIYKKSNRVYFQLVDALGNTWGPKTDDIKILCKNIKDLYEWTKGSKRISLERVGEYPMFPFTMNKSLVEDFIVINNRLAQKCAAGCGNRYFGNYSTRCTKLFPSMRINRIDYFLFSPRNTDKRYVTFSDLVTVNDMGQYFGRKPSVDTPIQLEIYKNFKNINFMIHGHAYIKNAPFTNKYFPCGDLREVDEICRLANRGFKTINLRKHGFIIMAEKLEDFDKPIPFSPTGDFFNI